MQHTHTHTHTHIYVALVTELLERVVAVQEILGSIPCRGGNKNAFAVVRSLLTILVSARMSKYSGSILLNTIPSQEQLNNISLQMLYTLELDLSPFPTDSAHFLPKDR